MRPAVVCLVATLLVGCAKSPDSISPAYVSDLNYRSLECRQLADEDARVSQALVKASKQQENARANDTVGVIFLGLPVSTLSGDNIAPEIASLKGQQDAIRRQRLEKRC